MFASGMAAVTAAILACVSTGETVLAQAALYDGTYLFLNNLAPRYGIQVIWVTDNTPEGWAQAFDEHPDTRLAYIETPVNPTLQLTDIQAVTELAHAHGARVVVDNTFGTPFCQRADGLRGRYRVHSTTKYLSGHGQVLGGAVLTTDLDLLHGQLYQVYKLIGGTPSPIDTWMTNIGLKPLCCGWTASARTQPVWQKRWRSIPRLTGSITPA